MLGSRVAWLCSEVESGALDVAELMKSLRFEFQTLVIQVVCLGTRIDDGRTLGMVVAQTISARESASLLADKPEVDLVLRVAGTRQIGQAFEAVGYGRTEGKRLYLVAGGTSEGDISRLALRLEDLNGSGWKFAPVATSDMPMPGGALDLVERGALLSAGL